MTKTSPPTAAGPDAGSGVAATLPLGDDTATSTVDAADASSHATRIAASKPGAPGYDWTVHYGTDDLYTHTFGDGTVVVIKAFGAIYSKTFLYKLRGLTSDTDIEFAAIDRAACPAAREVLLGLDDTAGDPLDELWTAWIAAGTAHADGDPGLTPGKSVG